MIRDKEFYGISDILHFNVYASLLKEHIIKEERVIIKVFKKDNQYVFASLYSLNDPSKDRLLEVVQ